MIQYYLTRAHGNLELIDQLDLIGRTGELAKLFGIQAGDSTILYSQLLFTATVKEDFSVCCIICSTYKHFDVTP